MLDIPGLTERWYVRTYGFEIVETQPNPALLDAGQAVSLAFGVFANVALICRFLEHRPRLFTWVAMVSLAVHDILSISIVTWFGVAHRFSDGFTYNDAFWLSVAATAASTVCNVTLALDLLFTNNFDAKGASDRFGSPHSLSNRVSLYRKRPYGKATHARHRRYGLLPLHRSRRLDLLLRYRRAPLHRRHVFLDLPCDECRVWRQCVCFRSPVRGH